MARVDWPMTQDQMHAELIRGGLTPRVAHILATLLMGVQDSLFTVDSGSGIVSYNPSTVTSAQIASLKAEVRSNIRAVSASTVAVAGDDILATAGAAGITITLPAVSPDAAVTVKKVDSAAGAVTVLATPATVDGAASVLISQQYVSLDFFSDGTSWYVH